MSPDLALGLAAAVAALAARAAWRSHRELGRWLGRDPHARRRLARALALAAASALVAWAAVRAAAEPPQLQGAGADVVLALDVSASMAARDTAPSRLRRAVRLAERVARDAGAVRLGLVLFAADAWVALPLTQDRDALLTYLGAVDTDLISAAGTDLGQALDAASGAFDPRSARPRQILLLSDGEDGGSGLERALARARSAGIRVVPVGFGSVEGSELIGAGGEPLRAPDESIVHSRRVDAVLRRIAAATDGSYFREAEDDPPTARLLPLPEAVDARERPRRSRVLAAALVGAFALLLVELGLSIGSARRRSARRGRVAATAAAALVALGPFGWSLEREGDEQLARGEAREALTLYRKLERQRGPSAGLRIRIGNAQFRLDQKDQAISSYLEVLRHFGSDDADARFVSAFNMGTVLLSQERWAEARDALWGALLERHDSLEAKFNYEWALANQAEPEPDVPVPPVPRSSEELERESAPEADRPDPASTSARERETPQPLAQSEAERWLRTLEEKPAEPLRRQIAREGTPATQRSPRWQTW